MELKELIKKLLKPAEETHCDDWHNFTAACKNMCEEKEKPTLQKFKDKISNV